VFFCKVSRIRADVCGSVTATFALPKNIAASGPVKIPMPVTEMQSTKKYKYTEKAAAWQSCPKWHPDKLPILAGVV
jgi:hypothetical protein